MKIFFVLSIIIFSIFLFACEDEVIPIPLPPSPPSAPVEENLESQAPVEKPSEPVKTVSAPAKEPAKTVAYSTQSEDIAQLSNGKYVIQVAVFPVEASAKKLIKKLSENGIKAYSAKVHNPDPEKGVIGTYYRVRIGFFDGKSVAETFAKTRLEPLGYAWWVDKSRNDNIGSQAPEPFVEQVWEQAEEQVPEQISEQAERDAEREAAIAAAKEEYKAIAKAATAAAASSAPAASPPSLPPLKAPPPKTATVPAKTKVKAKKPATKEAEIDSRGKVKMKNKQ
jgi:cell division septation protein DedD